MPKDKEFEEQENDSVFKSVSKFKEESKVKEDIKVKEESKKCLGCDATKFYPGCPVHDKRKIWETRDRPEKYI